jgi:biopolymer transport protein ExbD
MARERYVVISVPNDNEFYIGKDKFALTAIPNRVRTLTANKSPEERVVFIKGQPDVKYSTLSQLIIKVKEADVDRIEVVPDRRKF